MKHQIMLERAFVVVFIVIAISLCFLLYMSPKISEEDLVLFLSATGQQYCTFIEGGQQYVDQMSGIMTLEDVLERSAFDYGQSYSQLEKLYPQSQWLQKLPVPGKLTCPFTYR
ncbi:hypothetical protein A3K34_04850 [candidate division WWE3 bacterium RIFOXYC1_FULL_40_10]|nr:MAG: hypothetical protein A3K58_04850 [candidate division WWE3 bacterium RIFOXYB1_FULL_40_22]OGC62166.1 MAG: hypothetical protein A3K37_04850 [candidate division WWE3 bacterium RIFOXYA1_FULL_40_11]OGC66549.1 MAG: hypothetical protein A3K34_04850 [candidate division WWE3 bacterium RIFOXYC1_FULL_40_10]OGC70859.1 MAG: hypothetical protein A2602_03495 [candidate division WWE3 bacterium RIFOXYD1_FULL_40_11]HLD51435.1 hypothetical protein [Patescibacteria group bacterium]